MSNSPSKQSSSKNWPLWLGAGFFGVVGIALLISLTSVFGGGSDETTVAEPPAAPVAETLPPANEAEHQALVTEVVDDLGREVLVGNSPTKGNPDADVVLMKFSDFQCGYCSRATNEIETFMADSGDDVLFVYKHFPLTDIHPEAVPAALASWAADQQGQFWEFHDEIFANQADLGDRLYVRIARDLGLDVDQFNRDRASEEAKTAVARDMALAQEFQLSSTPTFIMNDLLVPGAVPSDLFTEILVNLQAE
ncbi:MAG: thioredoxin domain-containing protein [Cyanobacteria bacterium P01_H01_bin.153]